MTVLPYSGAACGLRSLAVEAAGSSICCNYWKGTGGCPDGPPIHGFHIPGPDQPWMENIRGKVVSVLNVY
jgi:hypothetical protein